MENTENDMQSAIEAAAAETVENMTLAKVKELKRKYRDDFAELLRKFFGERPILRYVSLETQEFIDGYLMPKTVVFRMGKEKVKTTDFVSVTLHGDSTAI